MLGLYHFATDEAAGVSAEFVVIAAGTVALGLAVMTTLADGVTDTAVAAGDDLEARASIRYDSRAD